MRRLILILNRLLFLYVLIIYFVCMVKIIKHYCFGPIYTKKTCNIPEMPGLSILVLCFYVCGVYSMRGSQLLNCASLWKASVFHGSDYTAPPVQMRRMLSSRTELCMLLETATGKNTNQPQQQRMWKSLPSCSPLYIYLVRNIYVPLSYPFLPSGINKVVSSMTIHLSVYLPSCLALSTNLSTVPVDL